jgi:hypothetical protein
MVPANTQSPGIFYSKCKYPKNNQQERIKKAGIIGYAVISSFFEEGQSGYRN